MTGQSDSIDEAARWYVASARDDMDWDTFTLWLEADPDHRIRFEEIAQADAMMRAHRPALDRVWHEQDVQRPKRPWHRRVLWPAGLAAAAGIAVLVRPPSTSPSQLQHYATSDRSRTIALRDGSNIVLAPRSRLDLSDPAGTSIHLEGGAYFDIHHDPARKMTISAGLLELQDIGTRFDVQADDMAVRVAVAQGRLSIASARLDRAIFLSAGHGLALDARKGRAMTAPLDPARIGQWRQGQLDYDDTPLPLVLEDLERYGGVHIDLPADLRERTFSGTLTLGERQETAQVLARLMGLELVRGPGGRLSLHRRGSPHL